MFKYHASARMERVHLDFFGSLSRAALGNEYVLVMVDQFTKWVASPCPQTAEVTARQQSMSSSLILAVPSRFSRIRGGISMPEGEEVPVSPTKAHTPLCSTRPQEPLYRGSLAHAQEGPSP